MKFVVAGCTRSGTDYTAQLLTAAGINCGSSAVFNRWDPGSATCPQWQQEAELDGDASYNAAPFAADIATELTIVHVVRPPLDQISSAVAAAEFDASRPWVRFVDHHIGLLDLPAGPPRAAHYWLRWNELIEARAHLVWPLAQIDVDQITELGDLIGVKTTKAKTAKALKDTPAHTDVDVDVVEPLRLENLGPLADEITAAAERYGVPLTAADE